MSALYKLIHICAKYAGEEKYVSSKRMWVWLLKCTKEIKKNPVAVLCLK